MGWETIKKYTKECGCEYVDRVNDVDRPFMCYYEWETEITKRCDKHLQEYKVLWKTKKEQARQIREEKRQVVKSHLLSSMDIKHEQRVPIKQAYAKYKANLNANYTDRSIKQSIEYGIGDILMIQKIKNIWI